MDKKLYSLLFFPVLLWSQSNNNINNTIVHRHYYKDKVVSVEIWRGTDKLIDSIKTYHNNGKINEIFYFDEKGFR
ncbi:MAG TPA: hypothetical protein VJ780_00840, partial [Flavobacterium sp.]|nr:hypothetical protein [Flavobacterium sp.]